MKKLVLIIIVMITVLSCSSTQKEVRNFNSGDSTNVTNWKLQFLYEFGSVEETRKSSGEKEITVKREQYGIFLQFLDDMYYQLMEAGIEVHKQNSKNNKNTGTIKINPVFKYGYFTTIDITIYNEKEDLIHRIRVSNQYKGPGHDPAKNDTELAKYCSEAVLDVILGRGTDYPY